MGMQLIACHNSLPIFLLKPGNHIVASFDDLRWNRIELDRIKLISPKVFNVEILVANLNTASSTLARLRTLLISSVMAPDIPHNRS